MSSIWINGKLVPENQATVSVFDHGLLYGDGVFEGIRFYHGQAFMLEAHLQRLQESAAFILLQIPYSNTELATAVKMTIDAYAKAEGYIRLLVTRGKGPLGVDPAYCTTPTVIIVADELKVVDEATRQHGINAAIVATRKIPNTCWDARVKSLNYLNNVLARLQIRNSQAQEAIMLNEAGYVTEGAMNNLFIVKNKQLLTPPVTDGALAGITRQLILQLALENGIDAAEKSLTPYDLYNADECFLTGTGVELLPVRMIDDRLPGACPGPVYRQLSQAFSGYITQMTQGKIHAQIL